MVVQGDPPQGERDRSQQGYRGARWPKMVAHDGRESPSPIGPLLIWQQPHPIDYAELIYRARPVAATLERYRDVVFETAEFMASYAVYDGKEDRYLLGPPLIPAQENHDPNGTRNPVYEVEYWAFGLGVANEWRRRLGLSPNRCGRRWPPRWGPWRAGRRLPRPRVVPRHLHPLPVRSPVDVGRLGGLARTAGRRKTMLATLERVWGEWQFERMWGWDFPMMAMTAARLGRPDLAVEALLCDSPKNTFLPNGHNRQGSRKDLPAVPAGKRRVAHGGRHDGGGLGRLRHGRRAGISTRRELAGARGGDSTDAVTMRLLRRGRAGPVLTGERTGVLPEQPAEVGGVIAKT